MDIAEPNLAQLRTLKLLPIVTSARIDIAPPIIRLPPKLHPLPVRTLPLNERLDPRAQKSRILQLEPMRDIPRNEQADPSEANDRRDIDPPIFIPNPTLMELPILNPLRKDMEDPHATKLKIEASLPTLA
jgi:hypothetical protein